MLTPQGSIFKLTLKPPNKFSAGARRTLPLCHTFTLRYNFRRWTKRTCTINTWNFLIITNLQYNLHYVYCLLRVRRTVPPLPTTTIRIAGAVCLSFCYRSLSATFFTSKFRLRRQRNRVRCYYGDISFGT